MYEDLETCCDDCIANQYWMVLGELNCPCSDLTQGWYSEVTNNQTLALLVFRGTPAMTRWCEQSSLALGCTEH